MSKYKFHYCEKCGNTVELIRNVGEPIKCCGSKMTELVPHWKEGGEKHTPIIKIKNKSVSVDIGEIPHPMTDEHSINWVCLETNHGMHRKFLAPGSEPKVTFALADEKPVCVYSYCNLHGLWKSDCLL
jgi:superoxide reductase